MSTRCRIGKENADATITAIYCHFDGYPCGVGDMLNFYYKDENLVSDLISLGDISSLGNTIETTDAYMRDHNAPFNQYNFKSIKEYTEDTINSDAEFLYLYRSAEKVWECYDIYKDLMVDLNTKKYYSVNPIYK